MKAVALALVMLVASVNCWPQGSKIEFEKQSERFLVPILEALINELVELIVVRGWDPYWLESGSVSYEFPVPNVFQITGQAAGVSLVGLSDNTINAISYNILTGHLYLDLQLNKLTGAVYSAGTEINALGHTLTAIGSGSLEFTTLRINANLNVNIGIGGVHISDILIIASIGDVKSNVALNVFGLDLSEHFNNFFNEHLPGAMVTHQHRISNVLEYIVLRLIDMLL